jgi:hypothetical protein
VWNLAGSIFSLLTSIRTHPAARYAHVCTADGTRVLTRESISAALLKHFAACRHGRGDTDGLVSVENQWGSALRDTKHSLARTLVVTAARPANAALALQTGCLAGVSGGAALLPGVTARGQLANAGHGNAVILAGGRPCMDCSWFVR